MWWVRSSVCHMMTAFSTVALILFGQYIIVTIVILPWRGVCWHLILFTIINILAILSHTRAQLSDPGASQYVENNTRNQDNCHYCKLPKPLWVHHCRLCGRCIVRMDHHCPWINNCVGILNQKYFLLFLFYIFLGCVYTASAIVMRFTDCMHYFRSCTIREAQVVMVTGCFVEALLFGIFVSIMLIEQLQAIFDNTPGIDARKGYRGPHRKKYQTLCNVFGETFSWRWFLPLPSTPTLVAEFHKHLFS